jgi:hypothetical protein
VARDLAKPAATGIARRAMAPSFNLSAAAAHPHAIGHDINEILCLIIFSSRRTTVATMIAGIVLTFGTSMFSFWLADKVLDWGERHTLAMGLLVWIYFGVRDQRIVVVSSSRLRRDATAPSVRCMTVPISASLLPA